jgi:hypothetical protein
MPDRTYEWTFFIAHAGPDGDPAEKLYDLLTQSTKVFLDSRCLEIGDDWDEALQIAQSRSLITVVLISSRSDKAYYQREEIAAAIQMARDNPESHRVVPVFLDAAPDDLSQVPYGLRLKHGLFFSQAASLEKIAFRLLNMLNTLRYQIILYDSRNRDITFDFKGQANSFWTGRGTEARRTSPVGEGELSFESGDVLTVNRTTVDGRYEIWLLDSKVRGGKVKVFPPNEQLSEHRELLIHCEARAIGAKHGLRFVVKNEATETWLANEKRTIEASDWTQINVYFRIDPKRDFWLRIDDEEVTQVPSQLQIRGLVLTEKM